MTHFSASLFVHAEDRDWVRFLATAADARWIAAELRHRRAARPSYARVPPELRDSVEPIVREILAAEDERPLVAFLADLDRPALVRRAAAFVLARIFSTPPPPRLSSLLAELQIGRAPSPYEVLAALLPRYDGLAAIARHARASLGIEDPSAELFVLRRMLFERNVVLRAERAQRYDGDPAATA